MSRTLRISLESLVACVLVLAAPAAGQDDPPIPAGTEVQTTASGLRYSILSAGPGEEPPPSERDTVRVHYHLWLTDGTLVESSRQRGEPLLISLRQAIPGWREGLTRMQPGDRLKLEIPWELGYGAQGARGIPPESDLVFDVELLEVVERVPEPPPFRPPDPDAARETESGIRYEVLEPGEREPLTEASHPVFDFAVWTAEGELVHSSRVEGRKLAMKVAWLPDRPFAFLREVAPLMRPGAHWVLRVPPELSFGEDPAVSALAGQETVWDVRLVEVHEEPPFAATAEEDLRETESGLRYEILREGSGQAPERYDVVTCDYAAWLEDGTYVDGSYTRGEPVSFLVGSDAVLEAWSEAVRLVREGGRIRIVLPSHLAYGETGDPTGRVPPGATVVYELELHAVGRE